MTFELDQEERDLISRADEISREEIWQMLETKRYEDLYKRSLILSGNMLAQARCPKCTLQPPCKHYKSVAEIVKDAGSYMNSADFKQAIPPTKRENLMIALKRTANATETAGHISTGLHSPEFGRSG